MSASENRGSALQRVKKALWGNKNVGFLDGFTQNLIFEN